MKKFVIGMMLLLLGIVFITIACDADSNDKALIANDYSTITYNGKIYQSYVVDDAMTIPEFSDNTINAVVENRFFLLDWFLTDYIYVSEDGEYLYLETDSNDLAETYYYKLEES